VPQEYGRHHLLANHYWSRTRMIYQQNYLERYTCWKTQPIKKGCQQLKKKKKCSFEFERVTAVILIPIYEMTGRKKHEINVLTHTLQAKFLHKGMKVV
jgi:hypothetical protein